MEQIVLHVDPIKDLSARWYHISLTLIQPGKGRFTLAYMSPDYLHGSHAGLPGWIRVKVLKILIGKI